MTAIPAICRRCGAPQTAFSGSRRLPCNRCGARPAAPSQPRARARFRRQAVDRRAEAATVRKRMEVVFLFFILGIAALGARLVMLQGVQSTGFVKLAGQIQIRTLDLEARRGRIQDRNGAEIAQDVLAKAICINPRMVADPARTSTRLGSLLAMTKEQQDEMTLRLVRAGEKRRYYCRMRRGVDRRLAERILKLSETDPVLKGLWLEDTPLRVYPAGRIASQLIGPVDVDGRGIGGIEKRLDRVLRGRKGSHRVRVTATGAPIPASSIKEIEPRNGRDVRLTIDRDIQHIVERELELMAAERKPDAATAIVMDVDTGQVLAMANWPAFHPLDRKITEAQRRNRAVTDLFEPGSIFKMFTAMAGVEFAVDTTSYCGGSRPVGNRTIHCAHNHAHGTVDRRKMVEKSCNLAAGAMAERVGARRLYEFLDRLGFQSRTGIEFPAEEYGLMPRPEKWPLIRTVNVGFGQGIVVTPIQLTAALAALANGGTYHAPRLVLDAPGAGIETPLPRRVMREEVTELLRGDLEAVVNTGTGKRAKIAGYTVAGKTGTAQIAKFGRYGHGYVASFAGFVPARKPELAILVSVWHPRVGQYGGDVAAPVFREIARHTTTFLKIPPDAPGDLRDGADLSSFYRRGAAAHDTDD